MKILAQTTLMITLLSLQNSCADDSSFADGDNFGASNKSDSKEDKENKNNSDYEQGTKDGDSEKNKNSILEGEDLIMEDILDPSTGLEFSEGEKSLLCGSDDIEEISVPITFPSNNGGGCTVKAGNQGDNMSAYTAQLKAFEIPKNTFLCGLELEAASTQFVYDDELLVTFDGFFLAGANHTVEVLTSMGMPAENDLITWEWAKHIGTKRDQNTGGCAVGVTCSFPRTEQVGAVSINAPKEWVLGLPKTVLDKQSFELQLISTGNENTSSDCSHNGLSFEAKVQYMKR